MQELYSTSLLQTIKNAALSILMPHDDDQFLDFQQETHHLMQKRQLQYLATAATCSFSSECESGCCSMGICQPADKCPAYPSLAWIGLIILLLVAILLVPISIYCFRRWKRKRRFLQNQSQRQPVQPSAASTANNNQNINDSTLAMNVNMSADTSINGNVTATVNAAPNVAVAKGPTINDSNLVAVMLVNDPSLGTLDAGNSAMVDEEEEDEENEEEERQYTLPRSMYLTPAEAEKEVVMGRPADENAQLPEGIEKEEDHIKNLGGETETITQLPGQIVTTREKRMKSFDISKFEYGNSPHRSHRDVDEEEEEEDNSHHDENKGSTKSDIDKEGEQNSS